MSRKEKEKEICWGDVKGIGEIVVKAALCVDCHSNSGVLQKLYKKGILVLTKGRKL
jgi:nitrate/TMAO reductase-like tetraheme cytochrome c subunit